MIGATLYLAGLEMDSEGQWKQMYPYDVKPCLICERMIRNAGIRKVVTKGVC